MPAAKASATFGGYERRGLFSAAGLPESLSCLGGVWSTAYFSPGAGSQARTPFQTLACASGTKPLARAVEN